MKSDKGAPPCRSREKKTLWDDGNPDSDPDAADRKKIHQRADSGFYDSRQVLLTVAVRVLEIFGI